MLRVINKCTIPYISLQVMGISEVHVCTNVKSFVQTTVNGGI